MDKEDIKKILIRIKYQIKDLELNGEKALKEIDKEKGLEKALENLKSQEKHFEERLK